MGLHAPRREVFLRPVFRVGGNLTTKSMDIQENCIRTLKERHEMWKVIWEIGSIKAGTTQPQYLHFQLSRNSTVMIEVI